MAEKTEELKALEAELAQLREQLAAKEAEGKTLLESNTELQAQLSEAETTIEEVKVVVTHEKKKYQVVVPRFQHQGEIISAKDLKKLPKVVKALVEKGSGVLKAL